MSCHKKGKIKSALVLLTLFCFFVHSVPLRAAPFADPSGNTEAADDGDSADEGDGREGRAPRRPLIYDPSAANPFAMIGVTSGVSRGQVIRVLGALEKKVLKKEERRNPENPDYVIIHGFRHIMVRDDLNMFLRAWVEVQEAGNSPFTVNAETMILIVDEYHNSYNGTRSDDTHVKKIYDFLLRRPELGTESERKNLGRLLQAAMRKTIKDNSGLKVGNLVWNATIVGALCLAVTLAASHVMRVGQSGVTREEVNKVADKFRNLEEIGNPRPDRSEALKNYSDHLRESIPE